MIKLTKSTFYKEKITKRKLIHFINSAKVLSMGEQCKKFEENFSRFQQRKFSVVVSSGSMANLVLLQSLLNLKVIKKGDKVGVSALTWATNIMPLIQLGLQPVAIDCELDTLNVSPEILKKNLTGIKMFFITNVLGLCDNLPKIKQICQTKKIILLEDNCESLGSKMGDQLLGNFGLASTCSFFVGHHLSCIEGGMICTDNKKLYNMLLMVRAHGWGRNLAEKEQKQLRKKHKINDFFSQYTFYDLAYNARPTEINGFLGNSQMPYLQEIIVKRQNNFKKFAKAVSQNNDLHPTKINHLDIISNFAMPVICKNKKLFDKYKQRFIANQVEIRPIIAGDMTKQPFYKKYVSGKKNCKNANYIHSHGFYFPNNPELDIKEINLLCRLLKM